MTKLLPAFASLLVAFASTAQNAILSEAELAKQPVTIDRHLVSPAQFDYPKSLAATPKAGKRQAISRIEDLAGSYLMFFETPVTNTVVDYTEVTVAKKDATHITIDGFWVESASTLTAEVNLADGTISIPSQKVYVSSTYGECDLAPWYIDEENGNKVTPVRSVAIPGVFEDGKIILNSYAWGVFINEGTYKDQFMMLGLQTEFSPVNGEDEIELLSTGGKTRNAVAISQQDKVVTVKNFANYGREVNITLNEDRATVYMERQTIYSYYSSESNSVVEYQSYALTDDGKVDSSANVTGTITKNAVELGRWALLIKTGATTYSGIAYNSYKLCYTDGTKFDAASVEPTMAENVVATRYFNLLGIESAHPVEGLNIVVETFADGTRKASKRLF
ncbi:MAG: hypothetical protein IK053_01105 [Muribaculaceae bacterium]|nr:hypothetical protein [Muribaculaceae bacterium]